MIEILREISWSDLREEIRKVPLVKPSPSGETIYPYRDAHIEVREVDPSELCASSFYLIEKSVEFQRRLHKALLEKGHDLLGLDGALEMKNEVGEVWRLMPPVVEIVMTKVQYCPQAGEIDYAGVTQTIPIHEIIDGMHRVNLARELGRRVKVVHISGCPVEYPYYAFPNSWGEVRSFTDTPKTLREKKLYRREDNYALYRNFDVLGCGKPRNTGSGEQIIR